MQFFYIQALKLSFSLNLEGVYFDSASVWKVLYVADELRKDSL